MTLLRNLVLFVVLFLPLACVTAVAADLLAGPREVPRLAYPIVAFLRILPLLAPSVLAVPVLHFGLRYLARDPRLSLRAVALVATPLALLAVHVSIFGDAFWGVPLLALFGVPGALYGAAFGIVRR